ncbi:MAG: hypothetical protein ACJ73N_14180 [Bryobacteraceae bacterium]
MMTHSLLALSFLLAGLPLVSAAELTVTTRCLLNGSPDLVQPDSCLITEPTNHQPAAAALGSVRVAIASNPADFTTIRAAMTARAAYVFINPVPPLNGNSAAYVNVDFSETFLTSGPSRAGFIEVMPTGNASAPDARLSARFTVPDATNGQSISVGCTAQSSQGTCTSSTYFSHFHLFPVLLGSPLPITFRGVAAAGSSIQGGGTALFTYEYAFRFFESDGVTPVAVTESAEPSTLGFVSSPFVFLAYSYYKRKNRVCRIPPTK